MKKAWKVVLILALCILILGEVILGVGLLSGGSPERVWDATNEHYGLTDLAEQANENIGMIEGTLQDLLANFGLTITIPKIPVPTPTPDATATPKPTPTPAPTPTPEATATPAP